MSVRMPSSGGRVSVLYIAFTILARKQSSYFGKISVPAIVK